jgi:hypothetical protein
MRRLWGFLGAIIALVSLFFGYESWKHGLTTEHYDETRTPRISQDQPASPPVEHKSSTDAATKPQVEYTPAEPSTSPQVEDQTSVGPTSVGNPSMQQRIEQERLPKMKQTEERNTAESRAEKERLASYLLTRSLPSGVEFVVSAEMAPKAPMDSLAMAIVSRLRGRGKTASSVVFSSSFITSGAFDSFFDGGGRDDLRKMQFSAIGDQILLARITLNSVRPGKSTVGLISASIVGTFRIISANDGSVIDEFEIEAVGAGTSDDDAKSAAIDRILEQLAKHGY